MKNALNNSENNNNLIIKCNFNYVIYKDPKVIVLFLVEINSGKNWTFESIKIYEEFLFIYFNFNNIGNSKQGRHKSYSRQRVTVKTVINGVCDMNKRGGDIKWNLRIKGKDLKRLRL